MVRRFFTLFQREISGLHEAAFLLAFFALFSKVLALVRDRFLTDAFGASANLDIYYAAFRIPDFIYVSLASIVASAVLIPFIVEKMDKKEDVQRFFNGIFTLFFVAMVVVSALAFVAMPAMTKLVAPGFDVVAQSKLTLLSRIMLLSPFLLGLSGLFASITQSLRRFFVYALGPILYNLGIIVGILAFYPVFGLAGLAYGVVLGAVLHVLIQLPVLIKHRLVPRFSVAIDWHEIRSVLILSLPRTVTLSAHHLTLLVLVAMASLMSEGSISVFNLSFNLQSVPLSIIGVSYSIAAFPTLARLFSHGDKEAFVRQVVTATRHIIFWSLPIIILFIVLRAQIVRTILGTGHFSWEDTRLTAAALALFVISVVAQSLILLVVRAYYAAGQTRIPLFINVASSFGIIIVAVMLGALFEAVPVFAFFVEALFRVDDIVGTEILMLPLAFSIGVVLNLWVLWRFFKRDFAIPSRAITRTLRQSFLGAMVMGTVAYQLLQVLDGVVDINTFVGIFAQGFFAGVGGILAGVVVLKLMGNPEIDEIMRSLRKKFWRRGPIVPDQDEL